MILSACTQERVILCSRGCCARAPAQPQVMFDRDRSGSPFWTEKESSCS